MIARVEDYLTGKGSYKTIAEAYGIGCTTFKNWANKYREHGSTAFVETKGNRKYSKEFKTECVEAVIQGKGSVDDIVSKYNISNRSVLWNWIKKTRLEERKEIVEYCLSHKRDYKSTAALYDVSYSQVYSWVKKYVTDGEAGLADRRGHHKADDEVDELERLRRENLRLNIMGPLSRPLTKKTL